MRKARTIILVCLLLSCGFLAAVNFIPPLKNAAGAGRGFEWVVACLIGTAAIAGVLVDGYDYSEPSSSGEIWHKHSPVKERLANVHITDMLRAERQYVLYNSPANLLVLLTLLMWDNRQSENIICQRLNPLIEYRRPLIFIQRQQIKQRETIVKNVLSAIENTVKSQRDINNRQFSNLKPDNLNHHPDEPCQRTLEIVRAIISLHLEKRRHEDIVDALNAGAANHLGKSAVPQK
jgi:hypothetical protein